MKKQRSVLFYWNLVLLAVGSFAVSSYVLNYDTSTLNDELILVIIPLVIMGYFFARSSVRKPIDQIRENLFHHEGDHFSQTIDIKKPWEFREISEAINLMKKNVLNASRFIKSIENGELDVNYSENGIADHENTEENVSRSQDPLEGALLSMRAKMREIAKEDKERNWITEGLAKFIDLLRADNDDLKGLSDKIISNLVKYTEVNQGGLFIVSNDEDSASKEEGYLELVACYAYNRKKFLDRKVKIGEGMLGQVCMEKQTVHLKEIPEDYINITSGLGDAPPSSLLIVPLKMNDEVYGLIELAAFQEFPDYKIELIERLGENIASTISSVQINEKTKSLLKASQQQTEELRAQEEEMRQNQEEMQATQEALERKQKELEISEKRSKAIFENSNDCIIVCEVSGKINALNGSAKELFKVGDHGLRGDLQMIQKFIKKFDPDNPQFFLNKKRRTKVTNAKGAQANVEVYLNREDFGGLINYVVYARDITKEMEKEHQIAENLMYLDELKAEAKKKEKEAK